LPDPEALDIDCLLDRRDSFGMVPNLLDDVISNKEVLKMVCDVLSAAAIESQTTGETGASIKEDIVCEASNGLTTSDATTFPHSESKRLVPDVLASAGGVTVSYFEWVQNNQGYYWDEDEVNEKLETKLKKAFNEIYDMHEKRQIDMRLAAYIIGLKR